MKKIYSMIFILCLSYTATSQNIDFPDYFFKMRLLAASTSNSTAKDINGNNIVIDVNQDGEIAISEALLVYELTPAQGAGSVESFEGIANFTNVRELNFVSPFDLIDDLDLTALINLKILNCNMQELKNLNISGLLNLEEVEISGLHMQTLNVSGATALRELFCASNELTSLNVSGLTSLDVLWCQSNQLTELNVSGLNNLERLWCNNNNLTVLTLEGATALRILNCNSNQLTSLDLTSFSQMQMLDCQVNLISSLNVSGLSNLWHLDCIQNELTTLDLSGLSSLQWFDAASNNLTSLNVAGLTNLVRFGCVLNPITTLNFSGLSNLMEIGAWSCNLQSLYIKGTGYTTLPTGILGIANNPNLQYVCTDDGNIPQVSELVDSLGYTDCVVDSNCELSLENIPLVGHFSIYPNPTTSTINIQTSDIFQARSISISNMLGQLVLVIPNATNTIDVSHLKSGNYFIKINSDKGTTNAKFVKN